MKILIAITYYIPNISGLTLYAQRLAEGLVKRGCQVTVFTSRYDHSLPKREVINGVTVRRSFVLFQIGKGVVMPFLPLETFLMARHVDVINCHLPQFESFLFAIIGKILGKKVILTHHTDLSGWKGLLNRFSELTLWLGQLIASVFADKIVPYTKDYAERSWYLQLFKNKLEFIYPPILTGKPNNKLKENYLLKIKSPKWVIGFAGRIARQKGIPYLLKAIPYLEEKLASFKIVFAGPHQKVVGENYLKEIERLVSRYRKHLYFFGGIPSEKMATFYTLCDVLVLPSDDRLESFGIVQVESMLNHCPVVATNLPGVRIPIRLTKMGLIVPPRDPKALAEVIIKVLRNKKKFLKPKEKIEKIFNYEETIRKYEKLFKV